MEDEEVGEVPNTNTHTGNDNNNTATTTMAAPAVPVATTAVSSSGTAPAPTTSVEALLKENAELKAKLKSVEVNFEQTCHVLENKLLSLTTELQQQKSSSQGLNEINQKYAEKISQLQQSLNSANEQTNVLTGKLNNALQQISNMESEKRDALLSVAKDQNEMESLRDSFSKLQKELDDQKRIKSQQNQHINELESQISAIQFGNSRVEQELKLVSKERDWLKQELEARNQEYSNYRREKSATLANLQAEFDHLKSEVSTLQDTKLQLTNRLREQGTKLEETLNKLREMQEEKLLMEEQFRREMETKERLSKLYQTSSEEAIQRAQQLEGAFKEIQNVLEQERKKRQELVSHFEEALNQQREETFLKVSEINSLRNEIENINRGLMEKENHLRDQDLQQMLSPTAAATSRIQKSGMRFTEVYSEYMKALDESHRLQTENNRLNECLNQILQEIEEKAPMLKEQREEYELVLQRCNQLASRLEEALVFEEEARVSVENAEKQIATLTRENARVTQECNDLNRQVVMLVAEIEGVPPAEMNSGSSKMAGKTAQDIITDRLVTFRNIQELKQRNNELLNVIRNLSEERENEARDFERMKAKEIQKQLEELEELRYARERQEKMVQAIIRQRDMYKILAEGKGAVVEENEPQTSPKKLFSAESEESQQNQPDYPVLLKELQEEFNNFKTEKAKLDEILREQLDTAKRESSDYRIELGKAKTQIEFLNERFQATSKNLELNISELNAMRTKNGELSGLLLQHQQHTEKLQQELTLKSEQYNKLLIELNHANAEKSLIKDHEVRLNNENKELMQERKRDQALIKQLQETQSEIRVRSADAEARLNAQKESLQKDTENLRQQLIEANNRVLEERNRKEVEYNELKKRFEKQLEDLSALREEFATTKVNLAAVNNQNVELKGQLNVAETRLSSLIATTSHPGADQPKSEMETLKQKLLTLQNEYNREVKELRTTLEATQQELLTAQKHIEQFKAIAVANEDMVTQLTQASDAFKQNAENEMARLMGELERSKQNNEEVSLKLNEALRELNGMQDKYANELSAWTRERDEILKNANKLQVENDQFDERRQALEENIQALQNQLDDAQAQYQRQVVLHARDVEELNKLKQEAKQLTDQLRKAETANNVLKHELETSTASWNEQKGTLSKTIEELEARVNSLSSQNNLLHDQLEKVSTDVLAQQKQFNTNYQAALENAQEPVLLDENNETFANLREVIRWLRREKDILQLKHELQEQELQKIKHQLLLTEKSLAEARVQLNEERENSKIIEQHSMQHEELMKKINEMNLLRESNTTLRRQYQQNLDALKKAEELCRQYEAEINPLKQQLSQLTSTVELLKQEKGSLLLDNERWRHRNQSLLDKYDRIDPDEHKQLKKKLEDLTNQNSELSRDYSQNLTERNTEIEELKEAINSLRTEKQELKAKELTIMQRNMVQSRNFKALVQEKENIENKYTELVKEMNKKLEEKENGGQEQIKTLNDTIKTLNETIKELENRLAKERSEHEAKVKLLFMRLKIAAANAPTPAPSTPAAGAPPAAAPTSTTAAAAAAKTLQRPPVRPAAPQATPTPTPTPAVAAATPAAVGAGPRQPVVARAPATTIPPGGVGPRPGAPSVAPAVATIAPSVPPSVTPAAPVPTKTLVVAAPVMATTAQTTPAAVSRPVPGVPISGVPKLSPTPTLVQPRSIPSTITPIGEPQHVPQRPATPTAVVPIRTIPAATTAAVSAPPSTTITPAATTAPAPTPVSAPPPSVSSAPSVPTATVETKQTVPITPVAAPAPAASAPIEPPTKMLKTTPAESTAPMDIVPPVETTVPAHGATTPTATATVEETRAEIETETAADNIVPSEQQPMEIVIPETNAFEIQNRLEQASASSSSERETGEVPSTGAGTIEDEYAVPSTPDHVTDRIAPNLLVDQQQQQQQQQQSLRRSNLDQVTNAVPESAGDTEIEAATELPASAIVNAGEEASNTAEVIGVQDTDTERQQQEIDATATVTADTQKQEPESGAATDVTIPETATTSEMSETTAMTEEGEDATIVAEVEPENQSDTSEFYLTEPELADTTVTLSESETKTQQEFNDDYPTITVVPETAPTQKGEADSSEIPSTEEVIEISEPIDIGEEQIQKSDTNNDNTVFDSSTTAEVIAEAATNLETSAIGSGEVVETQSGSEEAATEGSNTGTKRKLEEVSETSAPKQVKLQSDMAARLAARQRKFGIPVVDTQASGPGSQPQSPTASSSAQPPPSQ